MMRVVPPFELSAALTAVWVVHGYAAIRRLALDPAGTATRFNRRPADGS
jgi:hypothetical protein